MNSVELRTQRAELVAQARKILDSVGDADLTNESKEQVDKMFSECDSLDKRIEKLERTERLAQEEERVKAIEPRKTSHMQPMRRKVADGSEFGELLKAWTLGSRYDYSRNPELMNLAQDTGFNIGAKTLRLDIGKHNKSLVPVNVGTASQGGYLMPETWSQSLDLSIKYYFPFRSLVDLRQTPDIGPYHINRMDDLTADVDIFAEGAATDESADETLPTFSEVVLGRHQYRDFVTMTYEAILGSNVDIYSNLVEALGQRMARKFAKHAMVGAGTTEPQGIVTASSQGCTSSGAALTADKLIDLQHSVDPIFRNQDAVFIMHDTALATVRKLKASGTGNYLLEPSLTQGAPYQLLGRPVYISNDMDSGSSRYDKAIVFVTPKMYVWRECSTVELVRCDEKWVDKGYLGFYIFMWADGAWRGQTTANKYWQA